jgi:putative peptidoglycan lipid II flippase
MGGLLWLAAASILPRAADTNGLAQAVLLTTLIATGIAIYGLFLLAFGVTGWREAVDAIRQNRTP